MESGRVRPRGQRYPELQTEQSDWWEPYVGKDEPGIQPATGQSILIPQAEELRNADRAQRMVFQFTGLHDWRQVAIRVLSSVGWDAACAYEDTLYPYSIGENPVQWDKIVTEEEGAQQSGGSMEKLEVCPGNWQHKGMALVFTALQQNEQVIHQANHITGQVRGNKSGMHAAQALLVGFEYVWNLLAPECSGNRISLKPGTIIIYT